MINVSALNVKRADYDGYVRGETLDVFFERIDEDILNDIFKEELCNIIAQVNLTLNVYFIHLLQFNFYKKKSSFN